MARQVFIKGGGDTHSYSSASAPAPAATAELADAGAGTGPTVDAGPGAAPTVEAGACAAPTVEASAGAALEAIYRRYAGALRRYCAQKLGDPVEAEDVCQEVMIRAYQALPRYRPGAMWPWLVTIARNVCIDEHRRRARSAQFKVRLEAQETMRAASRQEASQNEELLASAMSRLSPRHRSLIQLADVEGWSYEMIAGAQGVSLAAVRSALMRARAKLRSELGLT